MTNAKPYMEDENHPFWDDFFPSMKTTKKNTSKKSPNVLQGGIKYNESYKPIHDVCKQLAINVYEKDNVRNLIDWTDFYSDYDLKTGFFAKAYENKKTKQVIIAYRGSDSLNDWVKSNLGMTFSIQPSQLRNANDFYYKVSEQLRVQGKKYEIIFTGHSLGGSLAQMMGATYGNETVTFSPYGTGNIKNFIINYTDNIINYGNPDDFIFKMNYNNNIGKTVLTAKISQTYIPNVLNSHIVEQMGDLKFIPEADDLQDYYNARRKKYKTIFNNTINSVKNGTVHVRSYERGDGTNVRSHTRSAPTR